jgi:L-lactate dehydrogenase
MACMRPLTKIAIIGTGQVGTATAFQTVIEGLADELLLVGRHREKAEAQALDLAQSVGALTRRTVVRAGTYADCADADIVVLTASPRPDGAINRADLLDGSIAVVDEIVPQIMDSGFAGIFLVITNPVDVVAQRVYELSGLPAPQVIGTGTSLDSVRLRLELGRLLAVDPNSIQAYAMGEHGDSQMVPWSHVTFWGKPIADVLADNPERAAGIDLDRVLVDAKATAQRIIRGKGTTSYAIAATTCRILAAILTDESGILPVSVLLEGRYGHSGVFAGVPCLLDRGGVQDVVDLHLTAEEQRAFDASIDVIRETGRGHVG